MADLREIVLSFAMAAVQPGEDTASMAIYFDETPMRAGQIVETGKEPVKLEHDAYAVFIDLVPAANWGHPSRYVFVGTTLKDSRAVDATMPPFLRGAAKSLRLLWRGEKVPDWTLAVR